MEYKVSVNELDNDIEKAKENLLNNKDYLSYITLDNLLTCKYIIKYNREPFMRIKDKFSLRRECSVSKTINAFCEDNDLVFDHGVCYLDGYSSDDAKEDLYKFYFLSKIKSPKKTNCRDFNFDEIVNIVKDFYSSIDNLEIKEKSEEILNSNHLEFVSSMPKYYKEVAGLFSVGDYILVKDDREFAINNIINLSHEVAHYIDFKLNTEKYIRDGSVREWITTAVEFLTMDYLLDNNIIDEDEYNSVKQERLSFFDEYSKNTIILGEEIGIRNSYYFKSLAFIYGYGLACKIKKENDYNLLYDSIMDNNGFANFAKNNLDFVIDEYKNVNTNRDFGKSNKVLVK